jgi:hypothetical protein
MKQIALVYHKNPARLRSGMDLIRWTQIGRNLSQMGL